MFKKIIREAIDLIHVNPKLIRIAFVTTFFHTLAVVGLLIYNINNLLRYRFHSGADYNIIINFLKGDIKIIVIIIAIGAIGYEFLYPIGKSAMIHYLKNGDKKSSKALGQGLERFFPMFEFINLASLFSAVTVVTTTMRLTSLEIISNPIMIGFMIIWVSCAIVAGFLWSYVFYAVNIEGMNISDAMKHSRTLAMQNIGITFKFFILEGVLIIRFLINLIVILGIPLLFMYIASLFNALGSISNTIIGGIVIGLIIFCAYLNAIIEAFFASYRFKVYEKISSNEE